MNILVNEIQDYLSENLTIDILCCGMIGSKQGWKDSGYFSVPFTPEFYKKLVFVKTKNNRGWGNRFMHSFNHSNRFRVHDHEMH